MDESMETFVPLTFRRRGVQRVAADDRHVHDVTLLDGVARAFYWQHLLDTGAMQSGSAIARAEKLHHSVVNELLRLTLLAPDIIEQFMAGKQPQSFPTRCEPEGWCVIPPRYEPERRFWVDHFPHGDRHGRNPSSNYFPAFGLSGRYAGGAVQHSRYR